MSREFKDLGELASHLALRAAKMAPVIERKLERIGQVVERTAKAEFGTYQPARGPFPEWPELADFTKEDRLAKGFTENDPLLRTGDLKASIDHRVVPGLAVEIGSTSDLMVYHEFGTSRMPARPVLGPAAFVNLDRIQRLAGEAAIEGLIGEDLIHRGLGYNMRTGD